MVLAAETGPRTSLKGAVAAVALRAAADETGASAAQRWLSPRVCRTKRHAQMGAGKHNEPMPHCIASTTLARNDLPLARAPHAESAPHPYTAGRVRAC